MKFRKINVSNFEGAFRGMRNPLDSWAKSDSEFGIGNVDMTDEAEQEVADAWIANEEQLNNKKYEEYSDDYEDVYADYVNWLEDEGILKNILNGRNGEICEYAFIGPKDLDLAQRLIKSGPEHCKFLRQIQVSVDITAPLYWWKEFDTYKVGTTANSTSTMHTLCKSPITKDKFAFDYDSGDIIVSQGKSIDGEWELVFTDYIDDIIDMCENLRKKYCITNDKRYWRALVQILPEAFLQTRTVTLSYANLRNIYFQRRAHKLTEWRDEFIEFIKSLPYAYELITLEDENENTETD